MFDFDEVVTAPLHGFAGALDYWRRASCKPWLRADRAADAGAQRPQRPLRSRRVAANGGRGGRGGRAGTARRRRPRRLPAGTVSRPPGLAGAPLARILPRRTLRRCAAATPRPPAPAPLATDGPHDDTHALSRDLQGLRHPRRRRQDADRAGRARHRPGAGHAGAGARPRHAGRRPRRAAVRARARRRAGGRHPRVGRRGDRHRAGGDADDLLRRPAPRHPVQRDGDGQPQPARLQRPQDGDRRHDAVRRRHPAAAGADRGRHAAPRRRRATARRTSAPPTSAASSTTCGWRDR